MGLGKLRNPTNADLNTSTIILVVVKCIFIIENRLEFLKRSGYWISKKFPTNSNWKE